MVSYGGLAWSWGCHLVCSTVLRGLQEGGGLRGLWVVKPQLARIAFEPLGWPVGKEGMMKVPASPIQEMTVGGSGWGTVPLQ